MTLSSRRPPNQSSTVGSREPAATTAIAHPSRAAAVPTPRRCLLPTARMRKNALASRISTMPTVKTNSALPRRLRFEWRNPAQDTRLKREQHVQQGDQPRQRDARRVEVPVQVLLRRHLRLAAGGEEHDSGHHRDHCGESVLQQRDSMTAVGLRSDATLVIITQLPAAQAISATWLSPTEMLGQCSRVSIMQRQRLPVERRDHGKAAQREDHRRTDQRLLVDQRPPDAYTGGQCEQTGDHPDGQPNASPSRTWTMEERSDGMRPSR